MMFNMFGPQQQGLRMPTRPGLGLTMGSPPSPGAQPGVPGFQIPPGMVDQANAAMLRGSPQISPMALMQLANLAGVGQQPQMQLPMPYRAPVPQTAMYRPRRSLFSNTGS